MFKVYKLIILKNIDFPVPKAGKMGVDRCLICIANLKSIEVEIHTFQWEQLCNTLLSSETGNRDVIKDECPLCPYCFNIVEETRELKRRIEEINSEVRSKVLIIKARISDSDGNLQGPEFFQLNSLRQSLLGLISENCAYYLELLIVCI